MPQRRVLGIDPSTSGFYYGFIASGAESGKVELLEFGSQTVIEVGALASLFERLNPDFLVLETLDGWIASKNRFESLAKSAMVMGYIQAIADVLERQVKQVSVKEWRKGLGIRGDEQDAQVAAILKLLIVNEPKRWNNHVRDATGLAIYGASSLV